MKKYIKMLPLILYPYAYLLLFLTFFLAGDAFEWIEHNITENFVIILIQAYHIIVLIDAIYGAVGVARSDDTPKQAAHMNLLIKGLHIPAYIFHFILGLAGCVMSIWGIGFIVFAIVIDVLTIAFTGIHAMGCMIKLKKSGVLSTVKTVFAVIGSFIFCVDVVIAIVAFFVTVKLPVQSDGWEQKA